MLYNDHERNIMKDAIQPWLKGCTWSDGVDLEVDRNLVLIDEFLPDYYFEGKRILELGPGQCDFLDVAKRKGAETFGVDFDPAIVKLGTYRGHSMTLANLYQGWPLRGQKFDGIYSRVSTNIYRYKELDALRRFLADIAASMELGAWFLWVPFNQPDDHPDPEPFRIETDKWLSSQGIEPLLPDEKNQKRLMIAGYGVPLHEIWYKRQQAAYRSQQPNYKILILHALFSNTRKTILDHIYCYPAYRSGNLYVYHHLLAPLTQQLFEFPFDAIIIDYGFLAYRMTSWYSELRQKYTFVGQAKAVKIVISQDEFNFNEVLDDWLDFMKVDVIYTPVTRDLNVLFPRCSARVPIKHALAGYSHTKDLERLNQFVRPFGERTIDVGTRVRYTPAHAGRAGILKGLASEKFRDLAREAGFVADISTRPEDAFAGDDWFAFLGSCRFTFATRAGASVPDPHGEIRKRVAEFLAADPNASFDAIEAACFPGQDRYDFSCVSPRVFEAAAARTGLILLEDHYLDGLEPYRHFIPLKPDFSNLDEVFRLMRDDAAAQKMIEEAYRFLVKSESFSYAAFVNEVLADIELRVPVPRPTTGQDFARLREHFEKLAPSQSLVMGAPPHWSAAARFAANRAQKQDELFSVANLLAAKRRSGNLRSIAAAEAACGGHLDGRLAGLSLEAMTGLSEARHLAALADVFANAASIPGHDNFHREWAFCEYVYDPLSAMADLLPL